MMLDFEDIRSYNDDEYRSIMEKIVEVDTLIDAIHFYIPELDSSQIKELLLSFNKIQDFQRNFVCRVISAVIDHSAKNVTFKGIEKVDKSKNYLYMSNHRDIVLDSALINYGLSEGELNTSEIAIGSNLLSLPWLKDLVRINKSFIVKRNIPKQEILQASQTLSAYIQYTLREKKQSVWIAQREGRAKDGLDKTNPGLLKMFGLSTNENLLDYLISMNITPVSISYEYDPCDVLKLPGLMAKFRNENYVKSPTEDFEHMVAGIKGYKGNVNLTFGTPINDEIKGFSTIKNRNELLKNITTVIDKNIYENYKLWTTNYIAYDLLNDSNDFSQEYTPEQKEKFVNYVTKKLEGFSEIELAKTLLLQMYANPVVSQQNLDN